MKTIRSTATTAPIGSTLHVFELSGLGKAPFKYVGYSVSKYQACQGAPVQPGTSCDACGTAIMNVFHIKSADGKSFKVGCDCVMKTGDAGLKRVCSAVVAEHKLEQKRALDAEKIGFVENALKDDKICAILKAQPHPMGFSGRSLLGWCDWMLANAGVSGKVKVARAIKKAVAEAEKATKP